MKYIIFLLLSSITQANQLKIVIIDSGLNDGFINKDKLCKTGHYDFVNNKPEVGKDDVNHGSVIANIITNNIKEKDYCLLIYKVVQKVKDDAVINNFDLYRALKRARYDRVDYINYSINGRAFMQLEHEAMFNLSRISKLYVAAGNEGEELGEEKCDIYPACYKLNNIISVGAIDSNKVKLPSSNYGKYVNTYELGVHNINNITYIGTSFATPMSLVKDINKLIVKKQFTKGKERDKLIKVIRTIPIGGK